MPYNLHIQRNHSGQLQGRSSRISNSNGSGYFHRILKRSHLLKGNLIHTFDQSELFHYLGVIWAYN